MIYQGRMTEFDRKAYSVEGDSRELKGFLLSEIGLSVTMLKKVKYSGLFVNGEKATVRKIVKDGDVVHFLFNV